MPDYGGKQLTIIKKAALRAAFLCVMLFIKVSQQLFSCNIQHLTETDKFIICDQALVVFDLADHLLINVDVHRLQFCG